MRKKFVLASVLYLVSAAFLFPYLKYYVDSPDTFSYITLAQKISQGNFAQSVSGFWSPLIFWLLAIPLYFNTDAITSFKILQVLIGWFALWQWISLVELFVSKRSLKLLLSLSVVPFLLSYALLQLTPDLLLLAMVLFYLNKICSEKNFQRSFFITAALTGALMYFSKSFGFLFFTMHFSLFIFYIYLKENDSRLKKLLLKNYLLAFACFFLLSSCWVFLLSEKYHHFTISETVAFNLSNEVSPLAERITAFPVLEGGLYRPPDSTAVNIWEDPAAAIKYTSLNPLSSTADFHRYGGLLKRNFLSIYYYDFRRQPGALFLFTLLLFVFIGKQRPLLRRVSFISAILTIILFYGLYGLILVHPRYVWICTLLMLLLSAYLIENFQTVNQSVNAGISLSSLIKNVLIVLIILFAVKRPFKELFFAEDTESSFRQVASAMFHPATQLHQTYDIDRYLFVVSDQLHKIIRAEKNIASIKNKNSIRDNYTRSSLIAFENGAKYFGQIEDKGLTDTLNKFKINYLLIWNNDTANLSALNTAKSEWMKVYQDKKIPLQVYQPATSLP